MMNKNINIIDKYRWNALQIRMISETSGGSIRFAPIPCCQVSAADHTKSLWAVLNSRNSSI